MMALRIRSLAVLVTILTLTSPLAGRVAVEWPRFRGGNGSGVADAENPPIAFGPSEKLLWKTAVPAGHSSPIVWNEHIFITALDKGALVTIALRRTDGALLWRRVAPTDGLEPVHPFNYQASSTPTTDGERVYTYFGSYGVVAYDFSGHEVWRRPLPLLKIQHGTASSPILVEGKVILQRDGAGTDSELLALDAGTGAVAWRTARPLLQSGWSTPVIWTENGRQEIVTLGSNRVVAYGSDGTERWWVTGLTIQPINGAVIGAGLLFASTTGTGAPADPIDIPKWDAMIAAYDRDRDGRLALGEPPKDAGFLLRPDVPKEAPSNFMSIAGALKMADASKDEIVTVSEWEGFLAWVRANEDKVLAIRPGGVADSTQAHVAWTANRGLSEIPSPLFYRGRLYFVRSGGMVTSYAPESGAVIIDRKRLGALGQYVASPIAADGRIYVANEDGVVVVFRAADTLDVLARNDLHEAITSTPAIADNKLYIRTAGHLWAFGG